MNHKVVTQLYYSPEDLFAKYMQHRDDAPINSLRYRRWHAEIIALQILMQKHNGNPPAEEIRYFHDFLRIFESQPKAP